jgi:hypothetical protein
VDLVQTSAHIGARPSHAEWQGKVFSRSGASGKYPPFVESTGYGTPGGLLGINCRHSFYPFFEGLSENAYSGAERDDYAKQSIKVGDKEISVYEATQVQRRIERKIREWKRRAGAVEAAGLDNASELAKVREWQKRMRNFIGQVDGQTPYQWRRQYARERV